MLPLKAQLQHTWILKPRAHNATLRKPGLARYTTPARATLQRDLAARQGIGERRLSTEAV